MSETKRRPRRGIHSTYAIHYRGFCGWPKINRTLSSLNDVTKNIFVGIFLLGCRAMELVTLTRGQITINYDDFNMWVSGMKVEKQRYKKFLKDDEDRYILDEKQRRKFKMIPIMEAIDQNLPISFRKDLRDFPIRNDTPLSKIFIDYVEKFDDRDILFPYTYGQISYRINLIGVDLPKGYYKKGWWHYAREFGEWWPHRIRAERACQLRRELRYDQQDLMDFFGWQTEEMAILYAKMEQLDLIRTGPVKRRL